MTPPQFQELINKYGGQVPFSCRAPPEWYLFHTFIADWDLMKAQVYKATVGCIAVDGLSAALEISIVGITWHFLDHGLWDAREFIMWNIG